MKVRLRRAAPYVVASLLLVCALVAGYVAHEASRIQSVIRSSDAAFRVERAPEGLWDVNSPLEGLLGVKADLAFRKAARLYDLSSARGNGYAVASGSLRAGAQLALARAEHEGLTGRTRSKAENLDAVITIQAALDDPPNARPLMQRSLAGFRRALRYDPGNQEAMLNLEFLLRLLSTTPPSQQNRYGLAALGQGVAGAAPLRRGHGY